MKRSFLGAVFVSLFMASALVGPFGFGTTGAATIAAGPPISQSFGIGSGPFSSNVNYFINANASRIHSLTVTMTITLPLVSTSPDGKGYWSFQVNAYTPNGYQPAYMQWVVDVLTQFAPGQAYIIMQDYYIQANDGVLLQDAPNPGVLIPVSEFTTGATVSISPMMNATGNVLGSSAVIKAANGTTLFSQTVLSPKCDMNGYVCNAQAPIVGFESQLVGYGNGEPATFTSAGGLITYSSQTPLFWALSPVGVPWVQYNGAAANGVPKGTVEKSNIAYGQPSGTQSTSSTSVTTVSSEPLNATLTTQKVPYVIQKGAKGVDKGAVSYSTSLTGFTWNATAAQTMTMGLPLLNSIQQIPPSIKFNSSVTSLQFGTINLFFKPDTYQTLITMTGNDLAPTPVCLPLTSQGAPVSFNAQIDPTQARAGDMIFDWSDIPASMNPVYSALLNQLCFTAPAGSYTIDPVAIDGSGTCNAIFGNSCSASVTTSNANDYLLCLIGAEYTASTQEPTIVSVTDNKGNLYHAHVTRNFIEVSANIGSLVSDEYALWSGSGAVSITITVASAGAGNDVLEVLCEGISGANTSTPFDNNAAIPATTALTSAGTSISITASTSNANDILVTEAWGQAVVTTVTQPAGFTKVAGGGGRQWTAWDVVSSTQSSVTYTWSGPTSAGEGMLFDAICASGGTSCVTPMVLDGIANCQATSATSCNATFTSALSADVVIIFTALSNGHTTSAPTVPAGCTGLTLRQSYAPGGANEPVLRESYCTAASPLSAQTFTCNASAGSNIACQVFAVGNAAASSFFDSNGGLPCTNAGTTGSSTTNGVTCTTSASNANDFVFGLMGVESSSSFYNAGTNGVCSTYSCSIAQQTTNQPASAFEYATSSATISSAALAGTFGSNNAWSMISDALVAPALTFFFSATLSVTNSPTFQQTVAVGTITKSLTDTPGFNQIVNNPSSKGLTVAPGFLTELSLNHFSFALTVVSVFHQIVGIHKDPNMTNIASFTSTTGTTTTTTTTSQIGQQTGCGFAGYPACTLTTTPSNPGCVTISDNLTYSVDCGYVAPPSYLPLVILFIAVILIVFVVVYLLSKKNRQRVRSGLDDLAGDLGVSGRSG